MPIKMQNSDAVCVCVLFPLLFLGRSLTRLYMEIRKFMHEVCMHMMEERWGNVNITTYKNA